MAKEKDVKKSKKQILKAKKRWYTILSPDIFNKLPVGEAYVSDPKLLIGREIKVNLMNLTRNVRQQNIEVKFSVSNIAEKTVNTETVRYEMTASSIKRVIRRKITRIDESLVAITADNKRIRIKPLVITRSKVKRSVETDMRKALKEYLVKEIKKIKYDILVKDIVANKFQKNLAQVLNKIYPVRITTIRCLYIEKEKEKEKTKKAKEKPAEVKEELKEAPKAEENKQEQKPEEKETPKKDKKSKTKKEKTDSKKE